MLLASVFPERSPGVTLAKLFLPHTWKEARRRDDELSVAHVATRKFWVPSPLPWVSGFAQCVHALNGTTPPQQQSEQEPAHHS